MDVTAHIASISWRASSNMNARTSSSSQAIVSVHGVNEQLYPRIQANSTGFVKVSSLHSIYYETYGVPTGHAAVFLHGGPGAGCTQTHARFFDPLHYQIVLFDQRGCGKSTPRGSLEDNTTWGLVDDIEKLRKHLGIEKWIVLGGSWGVTLALAYAQTHTKAVKALILRGVCLLRQQELDWFYKQGANSLFPFAWNNLISLLEPGERNNVLSGYYKMLTSDDPGVQLSAAKAWLAWEMSLSMFTASESLFVWDGKQYKTLSGDSELSNRKFTPGDQFTGQLWKSSGDSKMPSQVVQARLECHYFINKGFLSEEQQLLGNISKIRNLQCIIVQGRYDFVCPLVNAYDLHKAWPEAELRVVADAGHSMYEKGIMRELIQATNLLRNQ